MLRDRQSWAVTDGRGAPTRNHQLILAARQILYRRIRVAREGNAHGRSRRSDSEVLAKHVKSVSAAPFSG